jgi:uncharacterized protein involved in tolerance to divalent cations
MVESMTDFQIILCTCADREQAERIAHRLVPRFPGDAGLHSYEVPEFLVLPVSGGSESYLAWLESSLR